ncbi:MAG: hypothetical protein JOZ99_13140 [Actinobacteria bacterium]|nr:hypothetical protein [Actinomycetota bacterium]
MEVHSKLEVGDDVPRKGRARRFREARELKQGYDDGLFREGSGTLADLEDDQAPRYLDEDDDDLDQEQEPWDPDAQREQRDGGRS